MTAEIYLNECLKKRLLPFIEEHYAKDEILFWPDLATVHYAKKCVEFLSQENLDFVLKAENPPNVPQARGIEKFWALCKQQYAKRKNATKSLRSFKLIWDKISKNVASELGKGIMNHAYRNMREIGY